MRATGILIASVLISVIKAELVWSDKSPVMDPVTFVESIELAEPKYMLPHHLQNKTLAKLGAPPDDKKQAFVVGGGVTAFTENVKGVTKQDILDSTLFAQLAADKQFDREKDTINWYNQYKYVLGNIGYIIQSFSFQKYNAKGDTLNMDEMVIEIISAIATAGQSEVIEEGLAALRGLKDDDNRVILFSQQSSTSSSGNFQIYPCEQSSNGDVSMALGAFYFHGSEHETRFLFFDWGSSNIDVYKGAQNTVLNQKVYDTVRSTVSTKLGDKAVNLVAAIDL